MMASRFLSQLSCISQRSLRNLAKSQCACMSLSAANAPRKRNLFRTIDGKMDRTRQDYLENKNKFETVMSEYTKILTAATSGGGQKSIDKHVKSNRKLPAWERLQLLFDDYSSVLELGALVGMGMEYGSVPRAGMIAAIGKIHGIHCMVVANDATVKAGTSFPITVKKQLRTQEISKQNRLPYIFVVDSGGAFLPLQAEIFPDKEHGGLAFANEAIMNSMDIPQVAIVCGSCTAGGAYIPTMSQECVIVQRIGHIFLGGPPLVKAALGEIISADELGGAKMHCSVSGCADHYADTEEEAFDIGRDIVSTLNIEATDFPTDYDEPAFDAVDFAGLIPSELQHTMDMYKVIARLVDGSRFQEFKQQFGTTLLTGFAHIQGHLVGLVGNNGAMTTAAALKGAHFVQLCSQRNIPVIFLQNTAPESHLIDSEDEAVELGKKIRAEAKLMGSIACASVPRITVIVGNSFGVGNYTMSGRSFSPNFTFSWPNARMALQDPKSLVKSLMEEALAQDSDVDAKALAAKVREEVFTKTSAIYGSSRSWDDGVLLPSDTRRVLGQCLEIVKQNRPVSQASYSVLRM